MHSLPKIYGTPPPTKIWRNIHNYPGKTSTNVFIFAIFKLLCF